MWDFDVFHVIRKGSKVRLEFSFTSVKEEMFYTLEETLILGTLFAPIGPREWSPESPKPEGFQELAHVDPDTRISIRIEEMVMADNMRSWKTGTVGFLKPASHFWDYIKKRFGI